MTLPRSQPVSRAALGLSLMLTGVIGLFLFAGTHELRWLVMILPGMFAEDLIPLALSSAEGNTP